MSTLTHDTPSAPPPGCRFAGAVAALGGARVRPRLGRLLRSVRGAGARPARHGLECRGDRPWSGVGLGAVVAARRSDWSPCAVGGGCCAATLGLLAVYGVLAVAGAQFCYFSAVQHMEVGPAILIEFTAPAAVVVWLWLRHGQRPGRMTLAGAGLAALGLVLVLDLISGADLSVRGVLWALGAMVGCATYFIISADEDNGLPPLVLAWAGLVVGALALGLLGSRRCAADARVDRHRVLRRRAGLLVGAPGGPGPGHRGAVLRRRHRGRSPARLAAGVVRGAARSRGERLLGLAAPRRAARARSSCWAGC